MRGEKIRDFENKDENEGRLGGQGREEEEERVEEGGRREGREEEGIFGAVGSSKVERKQRDGKRVEEAAEPEPIHQIGFLDSPSKTHSLIPQVQTIPI